MPVRPPVLAVAAAVAVAVAIGVRPGTTPAAPPLPPVPDGRLVLADAWLAVDGDSVALGDLTLDPFAALDVHSPGGLFRLAAAPFEGAEAAGAFRGRALRAEVGGHVLTLRGAAPLLPGDGPAYVRHDPHRRADALFISWGRAG